MNRPHSSWRSLFEIQYSCVMEFGIFFILSLLLFGKEVQSTPGHAGQHFPRGLRNDFSKDLSLGEERTDADEASFSMSIVSSREGLKLVLRIRKGDSEDVVVVDSGEGTEEADNTASTETAWMLKDLDLRSFNK